jgi:two-component system KDP operon response regulator KdpE
LSVDVADRRVTLDDRPIGLTPIEFALLIELIRSAGRVRLHSDLLTTVWGSEYRDDVTVLRAAIYRLRHKVEPDPSNPNFIRTESGIGYSFHIPDTASNHTSSPTLEILENQDSPRLVPHFSVTGDGGA